MLSRIAMIRRSGVMVSGARGGLGGINGARAARQFVGFGYHVLVRHFPARCTAPTVHLCIRSGRDKGGPRPKNASMSVRRPPSGSRKPARPAPRSALRLNTATTGRPASRDRKAQRRDGIGRRARFHIRRLLAVEQHDIARQAEIAARPRHQDHGAGTHRRVRAGARRADTVSDRRGNGER